MKTLIAKALEGALHCPVYDGTVQQGMKSPCCVILPPEYHTGAVTYAKYKIAVRGIEELAPLFLALRALKDEAGKVFRGEEISASDEDGVIVVNVTYSYTVTVEEEEGALMLSMEHKC